jgi:hypothetical protein
MMSPDFDRSSALEGIAMESAEIVRRITFETGCEIARFIASTPFVTDGGLAPD